MLTRRQSENNKFAILTKATLIALLTLFAYKLFRLLFIQGKLNDYLFSENLLHYAGGYMRRSLLGTIIMQFPDWTQKKILTVTYSLLIVSTIIFAIKFSKSNYALLLFLSLPFGIRMHLFDANGLYRKECFFFIPIMAAILLFRRPEKTYLNFTVICLMSILMILIHESAVFLLTPVMLWIMFRNKMSKYLMASYLILTGICFLLFTKSPSELQINMLDNYFTTRNINWSKTKQYLTPTKQEILSTSLNHFAKGSLFFYLLFFTPIVAYMAYIRIIRKQFLSLLVLQMVTCLMLCVVAMDYGRWLTFVFISFFICVFAYGDMGTTDRKINSSLRQKLIFLAFLAFLWLMHLPHYLEKFDLRKNINDNFIWKKVENSAMGKIR